jgi:hypothetical protein
LREGAAVRLEGSFGSALPLPANAALEAERKINPLDGLLYDRLGDAYLRSRFSDISGFPF